MSDTPALQVFRDRLRAWLGFVRKRMLMAGDDTDRLSTMRRLADVRLRQFSVGKPAVTPADLAGLFLEPKAGRFDQAAVSSGLLRDGHLSVPLTGLGEETGFWVEACLSHQVLGADRGAALLKAFVAEQGAVTELSPSERRVAAPKAGPAPLPPAVARLLGNVNELWSMPAAAQKALQLLQTPDSPVDAVAREIEKEPGLATMCLRVINSAYYGVGSKVSSIKLAVVMLGYAVTRQIVSISALASRLGRRHVELEFDFPAFWSHSLRTAHAASIFSRLMRQGHPDEYFSAGLVHDIGRLVVYQHLRKAMKEVVEAVKGGEAWADAETRILGVTHAEIGACLCERWQLPASIAQAVRHHLHAREQIEELQVPREALVVAALCRLSRDLPPEELEGWAVLLKVSQDRLGQIREQSSQFTQACLDGIFTLA